MIENWRLLGFFNHISPGLNGLYDLYRQLLTDMAYGHIERI